MTDFLIEQSAVFEECATEVGTVPHPPRGFTRLFAHGSEIVADEVRQVGVREMAPEVFDRVQFRRVRRQVFHFQPGTLSLQVVLDLSSAMRRETVPQQNCPSALDVPFEAAQVGDDLLLFDRAGVEPQAQSDALCSRRGDQTRDGRHALPVERRYEDRRSALRSPCATYRWAFGKTAFIEENQDCTAIFCLFLICGQRCLSQRRIAGSLRSRACDLGR